MKLSALAVVLLALGIVVGFALAGGPSGGPASAVPQCPGPSSQCATPTPAPPQQREDQITIFNEFGGFSFDTTEFIDVGGATSPGRLALDPTEYPTSSMFRLEVVISTDGAGTKCVRLFDTTVNTGIGESEFCVPPGDSGVLLRRSEPFSLPDGKHEYLVQYKDTGDERPKLKLARIIAEWTE